MARCMRASNKTIKKMVVHITRMMREGMKCMMMGRQALTLRIHTITSMMLIRLKIDFLF